ncbi:MAG: futalosine hydrolase [Planctomycetes bacterium]|nr:futalosine hydrolase [Planctomycetota bacterium]
MSETLIVVSTELEARPLLTAWNVARDASTLPHWSLIPLHPGLDLLITGVSKANAAAALAHCLQPRHTTILNLGIGGTLPGSPAQIGDVVLGTMAIFADEGVPTPPGNFLSCAALGFGLDENRKDDCFAPSKRLLNTLAPLATHQGRIATVSECSGTDARAAEIVRRTNAIAEGMEGAAVALVAQRLRREWAEIRIISNTTGDRDKQVWKVREAVPQLAVIAKAAAEKLSGR